MRFNLSIDRGTYKIRFTVKGTRRSFRPGTKDEATAAAIVRQMTYEWEAGLFDQILKRYKVRTRDSQVKIPPKSLRETTLSPSQGKKSG